MSCVAEDPSVVKWLLDIGADIDRCRKIFCSIYPISIEDLENLEVDFYYNVTKCFSFKQWES